MIEQKDLPAFIEQSIPELSGICENAHCKNPYDIARQMIRYTADHFTSRDITGAKKCLALAEHLYSSGSKVIKNAIENVYVYSFSHSLFHEEEKRQNLLSILPSSLYTVYKQQMLASHLKPISYFR